MIYLSKNQCESIKRHEIRSARHYSQQVNYMHYIDILQMLPVAWYIEAYVTMSRYSSLSIYLSALQSLLQLH